MITPRQCLPRDWTKLLGTGPLGIGLDLATTEKEQSNPSALCVMEKSGPLYIARLFIRWKTAREEVTRAMVGIVFADLRAAQLRARRMCIDATNERFFAQRLQKAHTKDCPVQLVVASSNVENVQIDGDEVDYKSYCGTLYQSDFEEARMRIPQATFLKDDHRLVKKEKGRFVCDTAPDGSHGDTFDAGKLARLALQGKGRAEASGTPVGAGTPQNKYAGLKNPLLHLAQRNALRRASS